MMRSLALLVAAFLLLGSGVGGALEVRAGLDHSEWTRLLHKYVDDRGLVDYGAWKRSPDREALRSYLAALGAGPRPAAEGNAKAASLINAYNALTIAWVMDNYPMPSIRSLSGSFATRRHRVGGETVSLDDLEHRTLRPLVGYRVHAALVCAARSCPPLAREAYVAERLDAQLDTAMRRWLAREDLNRVDPITGEAHLSSIFKWFAEDFESVGGPLAVLRRYGPPRADLEASHLSVRYLPYDWTLNDRAGRPDSYGGLRRLWDAIKDAF